MLPHDTQRCRAELPSTATPYGFIRCSRRNQCERYRLALTEQRLNVVNWACTGNSFDRFAPIPSAVGA